MDIMAAVNPDAPARGRKRFQFDIRSASQAAEQGVEVQGLRLLSTSSFFSHFETTPEAVGLTKRYTVCDDDDEAFNRHCHLFFVSSRYEDVSETPPLRSRY